MSEGLYRRLGSIESREMCLKKTYCTRVQHNYKRRRKMMTDKFQKEMQTKLTKGLLDMIVLDLLDQEPMHGYQLISRIRKSFGVSLGASTVYPFLDRLEKKGYLKSEWNLDSARPQKIFSLTKDGQTVLNFAEGSLNLIRINLSTNKITTEAQTPIMVVH